MQEFLNFQNLQFVKNTTFSKFSQNLSFYFRDLRPKESCYKLQKESPKNLTGIGEPMVLTFGGLANIDPNIIKCPYLNERGPITYVLE
jgi:hypothetical protein